MPASAVNQPGYRLLLLGDLHFGESYPSAGARILAERGYLDGLTHLRPFFEAADLTVANLETPLVDPSRIASPFAGSKPYVHWGSPREVPAVLRELGVDVVSLANNHALDHGPDGLRHTITVLAEAGIDVVGVGEDLTSSRQPFRRRLPWRSGGGHVVVHAGFEWREPYDTTYAFYAGDERAGCRPLHRSELRAAGLPGGSRRDLHVAFPHWGSNYRWRTRRQRELAQQLLHAGAHLVVGHGAHCLQQIELRAGSWVVYGLGNALFHSPGRFDRYEYQRGILPYGLVAMLHVAGGLTDRRLTLRLYPITSDNRRNDYRPAPVDEQQFQALVAVLHERTRRPQRFDNAACDLGRDDLGHHLALQLGGWPSLRAPVGVDLGSSRRTVTRHDTAR